MEKEKKKAQVFQVQCPICRSSIWVDSATKEVMKFEKEKKKKGSLDELLEKEKKRKGEFDQKFEATAELEKERWKKAQKKFEKVLSELEKDKPE